jgi:hypothetical protein
MLGALLSTIQLYAVLLARGLADVSIRHVVVINLAVHTDDGNRSSFRNTQDGAQRSK